MRRTVALTLLLLVLSVALPITAPPPDPDAAPVVEPAEVPPEAIEALRAGRYWRASRILEAFLATSADSTPSALMTTARAEAGWRAWPRVEKLLAGRAWLDSAEAGEGWALLGRSRFEQEQWAASSQDYARFLRVARGAGARERGLVQVRRGLALARADRTVAALAAFDTAADLVPAISDWIALYAARAAAATGDTAEVDRRLGMAGADLDGAFGWGLRAKVRAEGGADGAAAALAERAAPKLDGGSERGRAWVVAGDLRLDAGDTAAASSDYRRALHAAPGASSGVDAARRLSEMPGIDADDRLAIGRIYLRFGNLHRGAEGIEAYLRSGRGSAEQRARLRYDLATGYFNAGRYAEATKRLLSLVADAPSKALAADALYLAARSRYRNGDADASLATLRRVADRYPDAAAATRALFLIADLRHDARDTAAAREYYLRTIESNPDADEAGLAMMRLADLSIAAGDWKSAADRFESYRSRYPSGRRVQQATYWAARAEEKLGRDSLALERYRDVWRDDPWSYYGVRAGERLEHSLEDVSLEQDPPTPDSARIRVAAALYRLDLLRDLDDDVAVDMEIDRIGQELRRDLPAEYVFAEALNTRGYTVSGIRTGWRIHAAEGAWNARLLRIVYPLPYRDILLAVADERSLDAALIAGLVRQESMFNAGARSGAGAIGLMQVMPATGRILARAEDVDGFSAAMLRDPEINLTFGSRYLKDLVDEYHERLGDVLSAYNAGSTRIERWQRFPEWAIDPELFVERIPFTETRDYVKIVQENISIYRILYPSSLGLGRSATVQGGPN